MVSQEALEGGPYDPAWERYVEARLDVQMAHTLRGGSQRFSLWREQKGRCHVCEQPMTHVTG
jgi:RNA-directed DNA polymerase